MAEAQATNGGSNGGGNGGTNGGDGDRSFLLQHLYVKDFSFESPNSPDIFATDRMDPETELNIRNSHRQIGENTHEVVLHIGVHAKRDATSIFLVELDQAGVFVVRGYSADETRMLLGTFCPTTLFPYAREAISSVVGRGGFPPLLLQPINFDALYSQAGKQQEPA